MNGVPLLYDYEIGLLYSRSLIEQLGHVTEGRIFVPMGVA